MRILTAPLLLACIASAGSETPPPGPPWIRELAAALRAADQRSSPLFVYLTKTH
ncbi:MAG: hypothetical protein ACT4PV_14600 [Planctomycetaceae bacterium]